jgi:O-antigen ligase
VLSEPSPSRYFGTASSPQIRFAKYFLIGVEVLLLAYLIATEDVGPSARLLLGGAVGIAMLVVGTLDWPIGALFVLIVGSVMPRFKGTLASLHVRPEHVVIGLVSAFVGVRVLRGQMRLALRWRRFDYFLLGYIFLNFFTSAVTSPEPRMTLRWAVMNAIVIAPYFLFRLLVQSERVFQKMFDVMLWVGAAESGYGIFCFLSNRIFATEFGMEMNQYGSIPGTYGTHYEPNLFGSYSACCAIMFLVLFLLGERSRWHGFGFLITVLGAAVSLSRAVILALPVVALVVVVIALKQRRFQLRKFVPLAAAVAAVLLLVSPFLVGLLRERFSTIDLDLSELASDETTAGRIIQMTAAVQNIRAHPFLGTGTASFQLLFNWEDYMGEDLGGWVGNTPLRILHDTGIIGLSAFLLFVGSLLLTARRVIRVALPRTRIALIALSTGLLLYAITFQSCEASLLAFTWVHFGLLAAGVATCQSRYSALLQA